MDGGGILVAQPLSPPVRRPRPGVLELRGADTSSMCGSCTGWTFFGTFILAPMLAAAAYGGDYYYRTRTGAPAGRAANPLAGADHMSGTPTITCAVPPISSTA